jgi:hypothetical protein
MKIFSYNKDNDPEMPDWQWGFLCFKPLDVLTVKLYKMKQYTWKESFNFTFTFFDYSLLDFSLTVGNYDLLITFLNFSGSRSLNYKEYHTFFRSNK